MIKGQWHRPNGVWRGKRQGGDNGPARLPIRGTATLSRTVPDPPYDPDDPHILAACNTRDVEALVNDAWQRLTLPERVNLLGFRRKTATAPAKT